MNTRELLELAAKAAGIKGEWLGADFGLYLGTTGNGYASWSIHWNPLTNDGDALRLAVKLGLKYTTILEIGCGGVNCELNHVSLSAHERHDGDADPYAATRRAIVRAAAKIGRKIIAEESL